MTDGALPTAGTDTESFTWFVNAAGVVTPIADIQGSTGTSPVAGAVRTTQGVVTALYPAGGFNGFYIQTAGADAHPGRLRRDLRVHPDASTTPPSPSVTRSR